MMMMSISTRSPSRITQSPSKGVGRKISRGGATEHDRKIAKKDRKIALLSLFHHGSNEKKERKILKKTKNSTINLLYLNHV